MLVSGLEHPQLHIDSFQAEKGQSWCLYGPNNSGINAFLQLITGNMSLPQGQHHVTLPQNPAVISFSVLQEIYEEELKNDETDFIDYPDPGTLAREFLPENHLDHPLLDRWQIRHCLDHGYRQLSSGQAKKLLLLKAILQGHSCIIIDSPYDGLDVTSCQELDEALQHMAQRDLLLFILVRDCGDIPQWCSHLAIFSATSIELHGPRAEIAPKLQQRRHDQAKLFTATELTTRNEQSSQPLVELHDGMARYGNRTIFEHLHLTIRPGEHTLVTGSNGSGKSTLLQLITGDHPGCYANDLKMFGRQRGSGESIWDVKRHIGIVSSELHRNYRVAASCEQVVLSGFFDSIGLYDRPHAIQCHKAQRWLQTIGLSKQGPRPFRELAYGQQRLVLIARALVKQPRLLLLDEPTQGLDDASRKALLAFLEKVATNNAATIIYVSHREDEYLAFYRNHIAMKQYSATPE